MAMIRDALSSLPARPAVLAAPLIVIVVLSLYYWDLRGKCLEIRQNRQSLTELLRTMEPGSRFRLADFTAFAWNQVRVVARVEPDTVSDECLLDWNWRADERESLIESGNLSVLIFGQQGRVVGYFELRRDEVAFDPIEQQLTPDTAIFELGRAAGNAVTLSPAATGG